MINKLELTNEQREKTVETIEGKKNCDRCGEDLSDVRATIGCFSGVKSAVKYVVLCEDCHTIIMSIFIHGIGG